MKADKQKEHTAGGDEEGDISEGRKIFINHVLVHLQCSTLKVVHGQTSGVKVVMGRASRDFSFSTDQVTDMVIMYVCGCVHALSLTFT